MNCPNCSKVVAAKDTFCRHCGAQVEAESSIPNVLGNTQLAPDFNEEISKENSLANKIMGYIDTCAKKIVEWVNNTKIGVKALINKIKSDSDSDNMDNKEIIKLLLPAIIAIAALLLIILICIFSGSSSVNTSVKKMYYSAELEDETYIFNKSKEIFKFDSEDTSDYWIENDGALFVEEVDSKKTDTLELYYANLGKDDKLVKLENDIYFYTYNSETLAYVQYNDGDYTLYVGNVKNIDKAKEIANDVETVVVSEDGSTVYYTDSDSDVYIYKKGDAERVEKDAKIKYVKENGKEAILQSAGDDADDRVLYWVKNGESKEIAEDFETIVLTNRSNFSFAFLSDWDDDDDNGTAYYQKSYNSEPVEIEDNVDELYLKYDSTQYRENSHAYLFYEKKDDLFAYKIGANKTPEKVVKEIDDYWVGRYGNLLLWLEDEEIMYYDLVKNEMNKFDIDDDVTDFQYVDGVIVYVNDDEETYLFKSNNSLLLSDETTETYLPISSNNLLKLEWDEDDYSENELYYTDSKQNNDIFITDDIYDVESADNVFNSNEIFVLSDWDEDDSEGTLFYYRFGDKKAVELLDDVTEISTTWYVTK